MYTCNICNSLLQSKTSLNMHYKSQLHKDNLKWIEIKKKYAYRCDVCEYYTNLKSSWLGHQKCRHHVNGTGRQYLS